MRNQTTVTHALAMLLGAVVSFCGAWLAETTDDSYHIDCESGQVYVVDTEQCVSSTDHEAHNEHAITDEERDQGITEEWHRAGTWPPTTTIDHSVHGAP